MGQSYMVLHDEKKAQKCFVSSQTLEISANDLDKLHSSFLTRPKLLEDDYGLIQQAHSLK